MREKLDCTIPEQQSPSTSIASQRTKEQWLADGDAYTKAGQYLEALAAEYKLY